MRTLEWLFLLCFITTATCLGQHSPFTTFITNLSQTRDSLKKAAQIKNFVAENPEPFTEDSTVHFYFIGSGKSVSVPGEFNGWDPSLGMMQHVPGTKFFYRDEILPPDARVEYKIWVDSSWQLDSLNPGRAVGAWGENSSVRMPHYSSGELSLDWNSPHGTIDTLWIDSYSLKVSHPVLVYVPPGSNGYYQYPSIYVTDGCDYITIGKMTAILDQLIYQSKIRPVIGIFVDPKTNLNNSATNQRMKEYSADDDYLDFLEKEVEPLVASKYPVSRKASDRLITGSSMGGLISTYAVLKRSNFITNCAAQSPAFWQADSAVVKMCDTVTRHDVNIYMDTGTIHDTQVEARLVRDKLKKKGFQVHYAEYHEGHNWTNWRARFPVLLEYFLGLK